MFMKTYMPHTWKLDVTRKTLIAPVRRNEPIALLFFLHCREYQLAFIFALLFELRFSDRSCL